MLLPRSQSLFCICNFFRINARKAIFTKFRRNVGGKLPEDFITWLEILLGGESDLLMCNGDSGYNYGKYFQDALLAAFDGDQDDVDKVQRESA